MIGRRGKSGPGNDWQGLAWLARLGKASIGSGRPCRARQARLGPDGHVQAGHGVERLAVRGTNWQGKSRPGRSRPGRQGEARLVVDRMVIVRRVAAGEASIAMSRSDGARNGTAGMSGRVEAELDQDSHGVARRGRCG